MVMLHWARKILLACRQFPLQILTSQIRSSCIFDQWLPTNTSYPSFLVPVYSYYPQRTSNHLENGDTYTYSILHKTKFTITGTNYYHWMECTLRTTPTLQKGKQFVLNMERNIEEFDTTCA